MPKIYFPKTVKTITGENLKFDVGNKSEVVTMMKVVELCCYNLKPISEITFSDVLHANYLFNKIKDIGDEDCVDGCFKDYVELPEEEYQWLFNAIDRPLLSIFNLNLITIKKQLFKEELIEHILEKLKEKDGNEKSKPKGQIQPR